MDNKYRVCSLNKATITSPGETSLKPPSLNTVIHIATPEQSDAHKILEGNPRRFLRIPSNSPRRADRKPHNDVEERHKNVIHDSIALDVTVAAPPSRRLIVVTMNSAKNRTPPLDPTNWPMRMNPMTRVLRRRGFAKDKIPFEVVRRTISIDSIVRLIPYATEQKKVVSELIEKWGEHAMKLSMKQPKPTK